MLFDLQVIANVSIRLSSMHEAGYAHRDVKPANVMWLPRENQWTLIDFGCAAPLNEEAPLSYTLTHAAPEVIKAWKAGAQTCMSNTAIDAWALGVMAYELLTGKPAFDVFLTGRDAVCCFLVFLQFGLMCSATIWRPS
jgi:serine/threonine protein kinase